MKQLLFIFIVVALSTNSYSQANYRITEEYQKIFKIPKYKYGETEYLVKLVDTLHKNYWFSDLINPNFQYINYLLTHFSDKSNYEKLLSISDSIERQDVFIQSLQDDSMFNSVMNKLADKFLNNSQFISDSISLDDLLNIAVKYFLITRISKEGYYGGKVCGGLNGIVKTEKDRKPHIEAFCFSTIFNNYRGEKFNMYNELVHGIEELYKLNLGIDNKDRLLRAQGAMYMYMRNNDKLIELLLFEYEKQKNFLPFVLKAE